MWGVLVGLGLLLPLAACSDEESGRRCVAGEMEACLLAGGGAGVRVCGTDFRWSGCDTPDAGVSWMDVVEPPAEPMFDPCPAGWRPDSSEGTVTCDPWPEGGPVDCAHGSAHFPGEADCAPVGGSCPSGSYAEGLPSDVPVVYLNAGAVGGDGSSARPFGAFDELDAPSMSVGSVVAAAKGDYDAEVLLEPGVSLWGACAAETRLRSSIASEGAAVLTARGSGSVIRNIGVVESDRIGIWVRGASRATLEGVAITNTRFFGLLSNGGDVTVDGFAVRGTRSRSSGLDVGRGIGLEAGATATLRRVAAEANRDYGIRLADPAASLIAEDVAVRGTLPVELDGSSGRGLAIEYESSAELARVVIEDNHDAGLIVVGPDSMLVMEDVVISRTQPQGNDDSDGRGMVLAPGTTTRAIRVVAHENHEIGVMVDGLGTTAQIDDLVVRDTLAEQSEMDGGQALHVQGGADASVTRALLERSVTAGMVVVDDATAALQDLLLRDTESRDLDGMMGRGADVEGGSHLTLTRARLTSNRDFGLLAVESGTRVSGEHVAIVGTRSRQCFDTRCPDALPDFGYGHGAGVFIEAHLSLQYFLIADSTLCGIQVERTSNADLRDGEVAGNLLGACVHNPELDVDRLTESVAYRDNGTNLHTEYLPIPDALSPIP